MSVWIALHYSAIIARTRRMTKPELLAIADAAGLSGAVTVLSTGNLIGRSHLARDEIEARLQEATATQIGRAIPVFCRSPDELAQILSENPFQAETAANPAQVAARIMRVMPDADIRERLAQACGPGESFAVSPSALWMASVERLSGGRLLAAMGAPWVGAGTLRSASSMAKILQAARAYEAAPSP